MLLKTIWNPADPLNEGQEAHVQLEMLVRSDQLAAVQRTLLTAIPVGIILSVAIALVSVRYGHITAGLTWVAAATIVNVFRIALCVLPVAAERARDISSAPSNPPLRETSVERRLQACSISALASGLIWALIPILCDWYTTPQTVFYLVVVCGTTAGAITHGTAYARIPSCFITPPLLSIFGCLLYAGGFDRDCLAATVLLYLIGLIRIAFQGENAFCDLSRLKNRATTLANHLRLATEHSTLVAEQMSFRATHDDLTGLLNRAGFLHALGMQATDCSLRCLMLLDLDGFKSVNDLYGHKTGDRVLIEVARRLRETLTAKFIIARIGGDEFAIFFDPQDTKCSPSALGILLNTAIEVPFSAFDAGRLGASIGIYVDKEADATQMLTCADEALYMSKSLGRNRHYLFDQLLRDRLEMRREIERDLLRAISEDALDVWFQPIFREDGQVLVNLEALLRWNHPTYGWIPPQDIVSTAARGGLSLPLIHFIFDKVCSMVEELLNTGLSHIWVAMNVSPREVSRIAIDDLIAIGLRDRDLPSTMLELEITEETATDIRSVQDKLANLASSGVRIAIDDFGIGYSSLASLRHMRVNRIKIDNSFVTNISSSASDQILVQAILTLGRSLGIEVVVEGVENAENMSVLQALGCELLQGFYLARPMARKEISCWLKELSARRIQSDASKEL